MLDKFVKGELSHYYSLLKKGLIMDEKNLVVKSNKLNQARYRLSLQEQKWVLLAISEIKPGDVDFKEYGFQVKDFMDLVGLKGGSAYSQIKELALSLMGKTLEIQEPDGVLVINWFDFIKYSEGYVSFGFSPKLKPYLLALKDKFIRYQVHNIVRLKSGYSVRIYELLKQYQSIGWRCFTIEELRDVLCIEGNKLNRYTDLRRFVLEVAKKELLNSDIVFDYIPIKKVRKVVEIKFIINRNEAVIKRSKKFKDKIETKKIQDEEQKQKDIQDKKQKQMNVLLSVLEGKYPEKYKTLQKQAKNRLKIKGKVKPGDSLTIKFKMQELLPGFLEKYKIEIEGV